MAVILSQELSEACNRTAGKGFSEEWVACGDPFCRVVFSSVYMSCLNSKHESLERSCELNTQQLPMFDKCIRLCLYKSIPLKNLP